VAFVAIFGLASLAIWILGSAESWWAQDLILLLSAGGRFRAGEPIYADPAFLYPPGAAIVASSVASADPWMVSLLYALIKVGLAVGACVTATRGWQLGPRLLVVIGVTTCLPFMQDLMLGNANALLVVAAFAALLGADRPRNGVAIGILTALFAKPLLIPILFVLLVRRRRTAVGAVGALLAVAFFAAALAGPGEYVAWIDALQAGSRFAAPFAGNHGLTAIAPELWLPVAVATGIGLTLITMFGSWGAAVVWAVTSGILLAPYAGALSALPVVLALPVLGWAMPVAAVLIAGLSPVATTYLLPFYAAAILVASLRMSGDRGRRRSDPDQLGDGRAVCQPSRQMPDDVVSRSGQ
jgi:hypothetical protein